MKNPRRLIKIGKKERRQVGDGNRTALGVKENILFLAELPLKLWMLSEVHSRLSVTKGPLFTQAWAHTFTEFN